MTAIWWIRRDLRLQDNLTLQKALDNPPVLPVFILDPVLLNTAPERRLKFLFQNLHMLDQDLRSRGSQLIVRSGKPDAVLKGLLQETSSDRIYAEEDFTPYARLRSVLVGGCLPLKLVQGQLGIHPLAGLKSSGEPYKVYTPFKKNWLAHKSRFGLIASPKNIPSISGVRSEPLPDGRDTAIFPAGEEAAQLRLLSFLKEKITDYDKTRDRMDLEGTSVLSPYFHFGVLGLRTALFHALQLVFGGSEKGESGGPEIWLNELIWREFYIHILYHFPRVRTQNFRPQYDHIFWLNKPEEFETWKEGRTGYPIVDAAMRQMLETGWMHNRARMIAASFLVKHLLIDWRWGERWFRESLLDGDLAANNGGWQWVAGTGTDAAPYFRIFNPVLQSRKFDPRGTYIRKWVPELEGLDDTTIHAPWEKDKTPPGYPPPLVDHRSARERALIAYQDAKSDFYKEPAD
jgi:deoxyribodipyrimidine photo-lyase